MEFLQMIGAFLESPAFVLCFTAILMGVCTYSLLRGAWNPDAVKEEYPADTDYRSRFINSKYR